MVDKSIVVRLSAITGQYSAQMGAAAASTAGFSKSVQASTTSAGSRIARFGKIAANVGKLTTLGVAAGLALSAKAAIEFESSFAGVEKTVSASVPQFERLKDSIRRLSTEIPIGVNELNRIGELGGQLGVEVGGLPSFIETIGKIGVTTNLAIDDAALAFARLDNILQLGGDDFDELGSTLVDLGNNFAATESEITTFALRIAPIGATVGLTADEVLGLATAFTSVGVPAERGGTAIQKTFIKIADAVATGSDSLNAFAVTAGLSSDAFAKLFKEDPARAFQAFVEGLDRVNKSGGNVFALFEDLELNNQRVIASLLAMANASGVLDAALDLSAEAWDENLALTEEAEKRFDTVASKITLAKNQINDMAITIGNEVIPIIGDLADGVGDFLAGIESLSTPLRIVLLGISAVTVAVGLSNLAFKGLTKVIGVDLVTSMKVAGIAAGALRIAIGGVLIGALLLLIDHIVGVGQANRDSEARVASLAAAYRDLGLAAEEASVDLVKNQIFAEGFDVVLNRLGISVNGFAEAVVLGGDALENVNGKLARARLEAALLNDEERALGESFNQTAEEAIRQGEVHLELTQAVDDLSEAEEQLALRTGEANQAREQSQLDKELELAERYGDEILGLTRDLEGGTRAQRELNDALDGASFLLATEDVEAVKDILNEYAEAVTEVMEESAQEVRDNILTWDLWEKGVKLNLNAVIDSLQKRLTAERDFFFAIENGLARNATPAVIDFLNLLGSEEKAAFLLKPIGEQIVFIASLEDLFREMEAFIAKKLAIELPGILEKEGRPLIEGLVGLTQKIIEEDETGLVTAVGAFAAVIDAALIDAGPGLRDTLLELFTTGGLTAQFVSTMFNIGLDAAQGLIDGLKAKYGATLDAGQGLIDRAERGARDFAEADSPSKLFMRLGADLAVGLTTGIDQALSRFSGIELSAIGATRHQLVGQASSVVSNSSQIDTSLVVNVTSEHRDLTSDLSAGLIRGGITELMEGVR